MLEQEVLRLREGERLALEKVDTLQKQVDELLRILTRTNTPPISATSDETHKTHRGTVTTRFEGNRGVKTLGSRLETDCMDHLRGKHLDHVHESGDSGSGISGHLTTASLSLWQKHTANLSANASCHVSNAELERLLSSSLNLLLTTPEITPMQIWNRICWIPLYGGEVSLQRLTRELKKSVFCVG
ncbi:hypothetical protein Sste5344_009827 [Sporothrix stenoceras]